jgi:uncharacterized protein YjbI with pentapeptide repeats
MHLADCTAANLQGALLTKVIFMRTTLLGADLRQVQATPNEFRSFPDEALRDITIDNETKVRLGLSRRSSR